MSGVGSGLGDDHWQWPEGLSHNGLQMLWGKMFGLYFVHIAIVVGGG